ncbi:MAG: hypothetical protein LBH92_08570 [Bacteroidales bacterium]|jgi:hypothetical protein|nr:hypothetical protein [Bacteroidales bacterium]
MPIRNRQVDFLKFRKLHPEFSYLSFHREIEKDTLYIRYHFSDGKIDFYPEYHIPLSCDNMNIDSRLLDNLLFHIGLCELISYWKSSCAPLVKIYPYRLSKEAEQWWKKLFYNGLGEFRYLNGIEHTEEDFVRFEYLSDRSFSAIESAENSGILIPVGGGKDSAVTLELLKQSTEKITPFTLNGIPASFRTIEAAGFDLTQSISVKRKLDPALLKLNDQGYLNGHTPFSALLAFVSLTTAVLHQKKFIALSNESSANESTVPNTNINHQYSKSFEFEEDFRAYYKRYITFSVDYFSFLRPLTESGIACIFSSLEQHHRTFRSCNCGSKQDIWCGRCPKCLFVWIILSPYLSEEYLTDIFGKNLGNDMVLLEDFKKLSGLSTEKPFECVGTIDEVRQSVVEAYKKGRQNNRLYQYFMENHSGANSQGFGFHHILSNRHFVPEQFLVILKNILS